MNKSTVTITGPREEDFLTIGKSFVVYIRAYETPEFGSKDLDITTLAGEHKFRFSYKDDESRNVVDTFVNKVLKAFLDESPTSHTIDIDSKVAELLTNHFYKSRS